MNVRKRTFWHAPSEDSNQPAHPHSLLRVFVVCMKKLCILGYPKCAQWRFRSDCTNAQSDLNLRWAHMSESRFSDCSSDNCDFIADFFPNYYIFVIMLLGQLKAILFNTNYSKHTYTSQYIYNIGIISGMLMIMMMMTMQMMITVWWLWL